MKASLAVMLLLSTSAFAQDLLKLPELVTTAGKKYTAVTVTQKRADGISIMHEAGTARIPFEEVPKEIQDKLGGFSSEGAEQARASEKMRQAAADKASAEYEKNAARNKELKKNATDGHMKVLASHEGGLVIAFGTPRVVSSGGLRSIGGGGGKVLTRMEYGFAPCFLVGYPEKIADNDTIDGSVAEDGVQEITDPNGVKRNLKRFVYLGSKNPN